jgi:hypothetical protein
VRVLSKPRQAKHLPLWLKSQAEDYLLEEPCPWLTFDAIQFLSQRLWAGMRVFEYGSGGSTLYWVFHGASCISIEHDQAWHARVRECLTPGANVDYRLVPPEQVEDADWQSDPADPDAYASSVSEYHHHSFHRYATQINEFEDEWFDLVMVDGRARPSCIKHSVSKVKIGGMLCVDNSDRSYYFHGTSNLLKDYQAIEFSGVGPLSDVMWKTTIFIRLC